MSRVKNLVCALAFASIGVWLVCSAGCGAGGSSAASKGTPGQREPEYQAEMDKMDKIYKEQEKSGQTSQGSATQDSGGSGGYTGTSQN